MATLFMLLWGSSPAAGLEQLSVSGITEPIHDVTFSASVAGTIATIFFEEGAHVKKNELILELDKRLEELEVERRKLIWHNKAELNSATAKVATWGSLLKAFRDSAGGVSKEELEEQELKYKVAVAEHQGFEIAEEREGIEYEIAVEQLRKRILRAPVHGQITKLFLEEGESCQPLDPLVHIVDTSQCRFICTVEEWVGRTLKKGQSVDLEIQAGSGSIPKKGRISFVSPVVDPASGLQEVKALFENRDGKVRPGVAGVMLLEAP
jgi:RND family efflux transporter MFP subunit